MYIELLPENGKFFKVNMHSHTNISDGNQTPEEIKEYYKNAGYSAVCFTDHEVLIQHKDLCDDNFIALHGYEVAIKKDITQKTAIFQPVYHFNMIAKSQDTTKMPKFFKNNPSFPGNALEWVNKYANYDETIETTIYDKDWINKYLAAVKAGGYLINYNHPQWSLQDKDDFVGLKNLHSIEIINGGCAPLNDNTSIHYEQMIRNGMKVFVTGGDDNHSIADNFKAWTMIKAPELTYDALISAYEKGYCYASDGPEILSLILEDNKIKIKTSPAVYIRLFSEGRYYKHVCSDTETVTYAEFDYIPKYFGSYFRIEVRDAKGNHAYSNAYFVEDINSKL